MLTLTINGIDRTGQINWHSLVVSQFLTKQVDTLEFKIKNYGGKTYKPDLMDEVVVWDGDEKIFGGYVITISENVKASEVFERTVKCKDYTHIFDRQQVVEEYENATVANIIADIVSNYCSGFTTNNVNCSLEVDYIRFNYEYPSKCLQQLAELFGYDWYIDYDKDVHFFSKEENIAPFELNDTDGNFVYKSFYLQKRADQLRNRVFVLGGEYKGTQYTEEVVADGEALVYTFGYKYSGYTIAVNGIPKTCGIDNISNPDDYDCLYNFWEKAVKFKETTKPAKDSVVSITGYPYLPVLVQVQDDTSIAEYGVYEYKIVDRSIESKEGARQRAKAELYAYAGQISEGSFKTYKSGLKIGQKIRFYSGKWGYNEWFVINKITMKVRNPETGELEYQCSFLTTKTFGMLELLQKLLLEKDKTTKLDENATLDRIYTIRERLAIKETISLAQAGQVTETLTIGENVRKDPWGAGVPPTFVFAPYTPTGWEDPKRLFTIERSWLA